MIMNSHMVTSREELGPNIMEYLTIPNPAYANNERLGFSNRGVPQTLDLFEEDEFGTLKVPRNAPVYYEGMELIDERVPGHKVKFTSSIKLKEDQKPAVDAVMDAGDGILQAATGKGKSVMACEVISRFGRTTMILVHKEFLMDQFTGHLKNWLGLTDEEIGICRGNPKTWTWQGRKVVIGMLQSIHAHIHNLPEGFTNYFGLVINDEVHRVSAATFAGVTTLFPAEKRLGLTATPKRADGLETVFHYHLGQILYVLSGVNEKPKVRIVRTPVRKEELGKDASGDINMARLISALAEHPERNKQMVQLLLTAAQNGRRILVLSDRRGQAEELKMAFDINKEAFGLKDYFSRLYLGGMEKTLRQEAEKNGNILFSTFQMAKEGLDIPALDTLFLATPNSSAVTVEQSLGRIARTHEGKKEPMVVDFFDADLGICNAFLNKRMKVYRKMELDVK